MIPLPFLTVSTLLLQFRIKSVKQVVHRVHWENAAHTRQPNLPFKIQYTLTWNSHLLRKSGTFTALDFAPPRRIKDPDTMSDAGSIRSNRSGVSTKTQQAIRAGAYRVSRLPGDMIFSKDEMVTALKPSWKVGS
jgi:hypothetical protein